VYAIIIICVNDKMIMCIKCCYIVSYYFFYRMKLFYNFVFNKWMPVCYSFCLNTLSIYVFIRILDVILISILVILPSSGIVCWFWYNVTSFIYFCLCVCCMPEFMTHIYMYTHTHIKCVVSFQVKVYWNLRSCRCYHLILHENVCLWY